MAKRRTSSMYSMNIAKLKGWYGGGYWEVNGHRVAMIIRYRGSDTLRVTYTSGTGADANNVDVEVDIEQTPCNYGGGRDWFRCPVCERRCGVLYLGRYNVACRRCFDLVYQCQADRMERGWSLYHRWHMDRKPKRMRWDTYIRRQQKAERKLIGLIAPLFISWERKHGKD